MKKILTLFVMLLCGWSIVSAQTPAFGYQAVVRTADNELVANTQVGVSISVMSGDSLLYSETQDATTDKLGMLNLLVGMNGTSDTPFEDVDWSIADTIHTVVTVGEEEIDFYMPLFAVPYALTTNKSPLTTDQIVNYLSNPELSNPENELQDYKAIMTALVSNVPTDGELWDMIKGRLVQYLKNRKDKAVDIAVAYLETASGDDVMTLYQLVRPEVKSKIMTLAKNSALENKAYAMQLLKAYLPSVNANDAGDAMAAIIVSYNNMELTHEDSVKLINRAVSVAESYLDVAVSAANYFIKGVTGAQVQTLLTTVLSDNSPIIKAFVYKLFYDYLDYKLLPIIKDKVNNALDNQYLPKNCGTEEIDYCGMGDILEN